MPGGCPLPGVLCRQRSGPQPLLRLVPLPTAPRSLRSSARRTHRYAEPEPGRGVRGGVNTCRARNGNTCEAVSTPPPPRLQTAHLHRTLNFYSPRPSRGGRVRTLPAGRGKSRRTRSGGLAPVPRGGEASPHHSERTPRSRALEGPAGVKSAHLG